MATLSITARFPLGTFLGHEPDGAPSDRPDYSRLYSALIHAAGTGQLAEERGGDLRVAAAAEALAWLEAHPPRWLGCPTAVPVAARRRARTTTFRDDGVDVIEGRAKSPARRKVPKSQSDAVAFAERWGWAWDVEVPAQVRDVVARLVEDVSCLGEADSPVVLEVADFDPTHRLDDVDTAWPEPGGIHVRVPREGRLRELEEDYGTARPSKSPSSAQDRHAWSHKPQSPRPSRAHEGTRVYRSIDAPEPFVPWSRGVALALDGPIDSALRVPWCIAVHRALAAHLGEDAPSLVTGRYAPGAARPANRLAIHYLAASELVDAQVLGAQQAPFGVFVVLVPPDATPEDEAQVARALDRVRSVYRPGAEARHLTSRVDIDCAAFWRPPAEGKVRYWSPVPALVAESRPPRRERWTYAEAALLSVGYAFRAAVPVDDGPRRQRRTVDAVVSRGVRVQDVRTIADSRSERFAHKPPAGMAVQPYTATLDLAGLLPGTALCAIGQARHLGGGLLLPVDVPRSVGDAWFGGRG